MHRICQKLYQVNVPPQNWWEEHDEKFYTILPTENGQSQLNCHETIRRMPWWCHSSLLCSMILPRKTPHKNSPQSKTHYHCHGHSKHLCTCLAGPLPTNFPPHCWPQRTLADHLQWATMWQPSKHWHVPTWLVCPCLMMGVIWDLQSFCQCCLSKANLFEGAALVSPLTMFNAKVAKFTVYIWSQCPVSLLSTLPSPTTANPPATPQDAGNSGSKHPYKHPGQGGGGSLDKKLCFQLYPDTSTPQGYYHL